MNGKASKRIRLAAEITGRPVKEMRREYAALPYHRRRIAGIRIGTHKEAIKRSRWCLVNSA